MQIKIKRLSEDAILPTYAHEGDAGADLYSNQQVIINPMDRKLVSTGLSLEIPLGYEIQIRSKSGLALNYGLTVLNSPGTIDAGYRGEIKVILINLDSQPYMVEKGSKIAQLVLKPVLKADFVESDELTDSVRGEGGFGSTGLTATYSTMATPSKMTWTTSSGFQSFSDSSQTPDGFTQLVSKEILTDGEHPSRKLLFKQYTGKQTYQEVVEKYYRDI